MLATRESTMKLFHRNTWLLRQPTLTEIYRRLNKSLEARSLEDRRFVHVRELRFTEEQSRRAIITADPILTRFHTFAFVLGGSVERYSRKKQGHPGWRIPGSFACLRNTMTRRHFTSRRRYKVYFQGESRQVSTSATQRTTHNTRVIVVKQRIVLENDRRKRLNGETNAREPGGEIRWSTPGSRWFPELVAVDGP